jgi:hypothetical protein
MLISRIIGGFSFGSYAIAATTVGNIDQTALTLNGSTIYISGGAASSHNIFNNLTSPGTLNIASIGTGTLNIGNTGLIAINIRGSTVPHE